jgi:hypothetical protein
MNIIVEECMLKEEYTLHISGFDIRVVSLLHICKCFAAKQAVNSQKDEDSWISSLIFYPLVVQMA